MVDVENVLHLALVDTTHHTATVLGIKHSIVLFERDAVLCSQVLSSVVIRVLFFICQLVRLLGRLDLFLVLGPVSYSVGSFLFGVSKRHLPARLPVSGLTNLLSVP